MAVAVSMASCSLDEVMEQPAQQAIGFSSFVGKPTKSATELVTPGSQSGTALNKFYVYGAYGDAANTYGANVFNGATVENVANTTDAYTPTGIQKYWIANKFYKFVAYSNGNNKCTNVTFDDKTGRITITDYEAGTNDLILADPNEVQTTTISANSLGSVALTFNHLLSQVAFEFKNGFTNGYKVKITDLKFSVNNKATYSWQSNAYSWGTMSDSKEKSYTVNNDEAFDNSANKTSEYNFVIPQSNSSITASFNVEVLDGQNVVATKEYNATNNNAVSLATGTTTTPSGSDTWIAGYKYKYTATIDANILSDVMFPIQFTVTSVEDWETADGDTSGEGTDFDLTLNGNGN